MAGQLAQEYASCHTNQATLIPTKLDRSYSDIQGAIDSVPQMKFLSSMTEPSLKMIAEYLDTSNFTYNGPKIDKLKFKIPLGTRKFIVSKMMNIFIHTTNNPAIENEIKNIENYPGYFGGICSYKYENCKGHPSENISTKMLQSDNVARRGFIGSTCQSIVMNSLAVNTALSHISLTTASPGSLKNYKKVFDLFHPGQVLSENVRTDLAALYFAINSNLPGQEWKYILYSLCTSPSFEVF